MRKKIYYYVENDSYGQHGTNIVELAMTKKEAENFKATHYGFLTDSYISALYYTQD